MRVEIDRWLMSLFNQKTSYIPKDIYEMGKEYNFSETSIKRSRARLGIQAVRRGKQWLWESDVFLHLSDLPEFVPPAVILENEEGEITSPWEAMEEEYPFDWDYGDEETAYSEDMEV